MEEKKDSHDYTANGANGNGNPQNKSTTNLINEDTFAEENEMAKDENNFLNSLKNCLCCNNQIESIVPNKIHTEVHNNYKPKKVFGEDSIYRYFESYKKHKPIEEIEQAVTNDINRGANINHKNKFEETALFEACKIPGHHSIELFRLLTSLGAIVSPNNYGQTILHVACLKDNKELMKEILSYVENKKQTSPQLPDLTTFLESKTYEEEQTPLHYAAKKGNDDVVRSLINDYKADQECKDYQGRTPLYLAAEHGQKHVVKTLIELGCDEKITNIYGQKALYWIIAKCPELASDVLDNYRECNKYTRKDLYYLHNVDIEPLPDKTVPDAKSILSLIVENQNLDLIVHPVISRLIKKKWTEVARLRAYVDLIFTFINIIVWNVLGVLIPYNERFIYRFPQDWWRIFLFIIGCLGMIFLILIEIRELVYDSNYQEKVRIQRLTELENDKRVCFPKDTEQKSFLDEEQKMCKKSQILYTYAKDFWNWFDIISILLLLSCIFTHIADVVQHDETIARAHIRIMSISVIFISLRLLKVGRVINEEFGMLVMTLYFVIKDIIVWILAYVTFWIPFTSSFYMLFGNKEIKECEEADPTNCTTSAVANMGTYNKAAFALYVATFGTDVDRDNMNKLDDVMTDILIGFYIGLTTLLMVNIFIALLTSTFTRVYDSSRAYFLLQRSMEILKIEQSKSERNRYKHLVNLRKTYVDNGFSLFIDLNDRTVDKFEPVKDSIKEIKQEVDDLYKKIEYLETNMNDNFEKLLDNADTNKSKKRPEASKTSNDQLNKLQKELTQLRKLFEDFVNSKEGHSDIVVASRTPRVDVLQLTEFQTQFDSNQADLSNVRIAPKGSGQNNKF